jgi:hypothetical protein
MESWRSDMHLLHVVLTHLELTNLTLLHIWLHIWLHWLVYLHFA